MSGSVFKSLAPTDGPAQAEMVSALAEAMREEGLAMYFTRHNREAAARLWAELLRLTLSAGAGAAAPQLFCLADQTAVAVMQRFPEDRSNWHRGAVLRRLAKVAVPFGKWRALREALVALDRQKAAFYAAHGPFYYLTALGTAPAFRRAGLGAVLLDHLCRLAEQQQRPLYVEATSDAARRWLRGMGFGEVMRHRVREHAPEICILVRRPGTGQTAAAPQARTGSGGSAARRGSSSGGEGGGQQAGVPLRPALRPAGSVRSR